jgi:hypothetical protein
MQESCYLMKLPMGPIRKLAGCTGANGMYYNPWTVAEMEMVLLQMTPVGKWVYVGHAQVQTAIANGATKWMEFNFLSFMVEINKVFIQDVAALLILHPEHGDHPMFQMVVFRSEEFAVSFNMFFCFNFLIFC